MATGRSTRHGDEVRVSAVLGDVLMDPHQGPLAVDDVLGPRGPWAQSIVDGDAHPAALDELVHQGDALLFLVPDHPGATMDVHEDRAPLGVPTPALEDVELVAVVAVAPVVDVLDPPDRTPPKGYGDGQAPPVVPRRRQVDARGRNRIPGGPVERRGDQIPGLMADDGQAGQATPRDHRDGQTEPSRPGGKGPGPGKDGGKGGLDHDHLDRKLTGDPPEGEADDGQRLPSEREIGVDRERGTDQADGHEDPRHDTIKAPHPTTEGNTSARRQRLGIVSCGHTLCSTALGERLVGELLRGGLWND